MKTDLFQSCGHCCVFQICWHIEWWDEIVGWHHLLNGHEVEQSLGVGDGQGGLACCSSWGCKESDTTEWLNWTEMSIIMIPTEKKQTKDSSNSSSLSKWISHLRYTSKHTCMQTQVNNMENFPNILLSLIHSVFLIVSSFNWLNQTQTRSFISVANKSLFCSSFFF